MRKKKKKRVFSLAGGEEFVCRFAGSLQIELNWSRGRGRGGKMVICTAERGE